MSRRRLLFLSDLPLDPEYPNGFSARWHALLAAASTRFAVDVVSVRIPANRRAVTDATMVPPSLPVEHARIVEADGAVASAGLTGRLLRGVSIVSGRPVIQAQVPGLSAALAALPPPDLLVAFFPYLGEYVLLSDLRMPVLFAVEEWWQRNYETGMDRILYRWRNRRLLRGFGARGHVLAISDIEREHLARWTPAQAITVIPLGVDTRFYTPQAVAEDFDVAVFGALADARNHGPARALFDAVAARPGSSALRWAFVGRDPHPSIQELAGERVLVTGRVAETRSYYSRARVVAAPAFAGAGAKTTLLKACSMGRPVVTTPFGVAGLPFADGRELLVRETLPQMAEAIDGLLGDAASRARLGVAARQLACAACDDAVVGARFVALCDRLAGGHHE